MRLIIDLHVAKIFYTCHAFLAHSTGAHNNQRKFADIISYRLTAGYRNAFKVKADY
jgi:hypothetical protein